jgi:hypothetical protein
VALDVRENRRQPLLELCADRAVTTRGRRRSLCRRARYFIHSLYAALAREAWVRLQMLRRFGNRAEGMFDIEWHVRLEIENDSEPQADLLAASSVRTVQDLGLVGERRSDDEITVPVNFSLLRAGLVPEGNSAPTVPYFPFNEVTPHRG